MDFIDKIRLLSAQVQKIPLDSIKTEESTKLSLVMPFLIALGYDVFNHTEVNPEFIADVGVKKGEKVDFAINIDGKPRILIECKWCGATLDKEHASQLYRYFSVTDAKFGILTNGLVYKFFCDLDQINKMDQKPYFEFNILDVKETDVEELKKFSKESFNLEANVTAAGELRYTNDIKKYLFEQMTKPDPEFVYFLTSKCYPGKKITQGVRDVFNDIVKRAYTQFINDQINERLKSAISQHTAKEEAVGNTNSKTPLPADPDSKKAIITTDEEIEAYHIVKALLRDVVEPQRIAIRDTQSYCGVLLDDNNRKPICRFYFNGENKFLALIKEDKSEEKVQVTNLNDIFAFSNRFKEIIALYETQTNKSPKRTSSEIEREI